MPGLPEDKPATTIGEADEPESSFLHRRRPPILAARLRTRTGKQLLVQHLDMASAAVSPAKLDA